MGIEPLGAYFWRHERGICNLSCSCGSVLRDHGDGLCHDRAVEMCSTGGRGQSRGKSAGMMSVCAAQLQKLVLPFHPVRKQHTVTCVFLSLHWGIFISYLCRCASGCWMMRALSPSSSHLSVLWTEGGCDFQMHSI